MKLLRRIIIAQAFALLAFGFAMIIAVALAGQVWQAACVIVVTAPFVCLVFWVSARWALRPATEIMKTVRAAERGRLSRLDAHQGPPEMRNLIASLNTTSENLRISEGRHRHATADFAHQMRTEVQLLSARIDRLAAYLTREGGTAYAQTKQTATRLHCLLTGKLEEATGGTEPQPVEVDVAAVVHARSEAWSAMVAHRGASEIRCGTVDHATIVTAPGTLEHLIDIFLDNAVKHSKSTPGQEIVITARVETGGEVAIRVIDGGPGMTAAQRERATARGWKADPVDGTGLGLSIADVLVKSNRGRLEFRPVPSGHGLDACVRFPVIVNGRHPGT
ncbi:sensor histidine kinase [Nocardia noduli]|uniref:sensor histidine kinase n=1 Tax=Nocardia noduli TaxID=2815722 RepID=UPI001C21F1D6|nr:HAMP domain-containing sensor histidine kinase [Nocardia noduli]